MKTVASFLPFPIRTFSILGLFIFISCQSQDNKSVDLGTLSDGFDVSVFYQERLKNTAKTISTDPKKLDKKIASELLDQPFFEKDTLGYYPSEGRFPTAQYLGSNHDWMTRNKKPTELFGYAYRTVAWSEDKDTLAILNKVSFPKMDMTENRNGNLAYLNVEKTSKNKEDYNRILEYLKKNCKPIAVDHGDADTTYWESSSSFYSLSNEENKKEEVSEIRLEIYQKSYVTNMEKLNMYSPGQIFWKKPF